MSSRGSRAAGASLAAGAVSVAALPLAIYATRFSGRYSLLHASIAIPVAALLGIVAIVLGRRAARASALNLSHAALPSRAATAGRVLGVVGLCMAASALVALGVYGLLEYAGSRG